MLKTIKSIAFRFGLPLLGFALIMLAIFASSRFLGVNLDLTLLIIALLIATAWYLGRAPGIFIALVFEAVLIYFATLKEPYTSKSLLITVNRLALFIALALFANSRRRAERILREQRELLEVTLRSIGDAVIATDLEGRISFINPTAEVLTGWRSEEIKGKPLDEIFNVISEQTREKVESPFTAVAREGKTVGLANHTLLIGRNGEEIPIEDSGAPIRDADGVTVGVIIVFHDVSERRQAEREREKLLRSEHAARLDAETSARLKDEFLATVSHELRTPLSAISGWASMLKNNRLEEPEAARALEVIERNARLQGEIINDLLDISQITTGKLNIERERVEMLPVLQKTVASLEPAAEAKSIKLNSMLGDDNFIVVGDADRLRQIAWNLISNAVKFTPDGGVIEIRAERRGTFLQITVSDSGIGIDAEFLPFIFDKFRQGDASPTRLHGGLGLGLSIVSYLVKIHGGEVSATSRGIGKGALFTVRLPLAENGSIVNSAAGSIV